MFKHQKKSLYLMNKNAGFSLVEIAVVLVIVGLVLTAGTAFWRTSLKANKWNSAKKDLTTIIQALKTFAATQGSLPCPDSVNADGVADACASCTPPCGLPFTTLALPFTGSTLPGFDQWNHAQLQYEPQILLTTTNQLTFCGTLYGIMVNQATGPATILPCVTDVTDAGDNGQINAAGLGYTVAAVVINDGDILGLSGKNSNADGEYEMARNPYQGAAYNDLVGELTLNDLYATTCNANNTQILLQGVVANGATDGPVGLDDGIAAYIGMTGVGGPCVPVPEGGTLPIFIGQTINVFFDNNPDCTISGDNEIIGLSFFDGTVDVHPFCPTCDSSGGVFDLIDCDLCAATPNGIIEIDANPDPVAGALPVLNNI